MKVLGTGPDGTYFVSVSHTELEKLCDKYYNKLKRLEIGDDFDLGAGYNYREDIKRVCQEMMDSMKAFERARETLTKFAHMVAETETRHE